MVEFLPAVRIARSRDPLRPELTDDALIEDVARAGGRVFIGLKPASARHTREAGEVPAIARATALAARAVIRAAGAEITMTYRHSSAVAAVIPPELAPRLRRLPMVDYVQAIFPGGVQAMTVQQDTSWGAKKVYAPWVWSGAYGPAMRGEGASVTILDGGVDETHRWSGDGPENMYLDCYYSPGAAPDSSCYGGTNGHGAHVAGIIASRDDEQGYIGIANNLQRFASIRVCNSAGICDPSWVAAGLDWVLSSGRPRHIVNMSIGWCKYDWTVAQLVAQASAAGVLMIASAGNAWQGVTTCGEPNPEIGPTEVMWPARYTEVMAVSGTWENDAFATPPLLPSGGNPGGPGGCGEGDMCSPPAPCPGSRSGPEVEIAAPFWAGSMWAGGQYKDKCGTSMSAPVVTAVAALVWSRNPTWTAAQVRQHLRSTAVPYFPESQFGSGRVNALNAVHGIPYPGWTPSYTASITGPSEVQPYSTCSFSASTTLPDAPFSYAWFVDGLQIPFDGYYYYHSAGGEPFSLMVTITNAQGQQASGLYSVAVSSSAPQCSDQ